MYIATLWKTNVALSNEMQSWSNFFYIQQKTDHKINRMQTKKWLITKSLLIDIEKVYSLKITKVPFN